MSKELEALETYGKLSLAYQKKIDSLEDWNKLDISYKVIEQALQRLEQMDNASPSEALKILEEVKYAPSFMGGNDRYRTYLGSDKLYENDINIIKQYILKAQEQDFNYNNIVIPFFDELTNILGTNDIDEMLDKINGYKRVLKIIIEKNVDIADIKLYKNYKDYCKGKEKWLLRKDWWLTKEEFDLLKRYSRNDNKL